MSKLPLPATPESRRWAEQQAAAGVLDAESVEPFAVLRANVVAQDRAAFAAGGMPGLLGTFDQLMRELKPVPAPSRIATTAAGVYAPPTPATPRVDPHSPLTPNASNVARLLAGAGIADGGNAQRPTYVGSWGSYGIKVESQTPPVPAKADPQAATAPNPANVARLLAMVGLDENGKPKPRGAATWGSYGLLAASYADLPIGQTAAFSTRPDEPKPDPANVARLMALALADGDE